MNGKLVFISVDVWTNARKMHMVLSENAIFDDHEIEVNFCNDERHKKCLESGSCQKTKPRSDMELFRMTKTINYLEATRRIKKILKKDLDKCKPYLLEVSKQIQPRRR